MFCFSDFQEYCHTSMKSNTKNKKYQFIIDKTFLKNLLIFNQDFLYYVHSMTLDCHFSLFENIDYAYN